MLDLDYINVQKTINNENNSSVFVTENLNMVNDYANSIEIPISVTKPKTLYLFLKRTFDIFASILSLIVLSPLMLVLSLLIKINDGGKAFYKHKRIGQNGKIIYIYKYRSMKENADDLENILNDEQLEEYKKEYKICNDPRITKIGAYLRKSSLDELPQLLNIIKGELSLVGPRPLVDDEIEKYGIYKEHFLSIKPGLTGYWQAYARNNATYESGERQRMELFYVNNCSTWLDIKIIFKTFFCVIRKSGAQ